MGAGKRRKVRGQTRADRERTGRVAALRRDFRELKAQGDSPGGFFKEIVVRVLDEAFRTAGSQDKDYEEQSIQLENLEVLQEIVRVAEKELREGEIRIADLQDQNTA